MFKPDLTTNLSGIRLKNPTMLAAGILGLRGEMLKKVAECGAGAVITKSIGVTAREGYKTPNIIEPVPGVVLNAMGLPGPGCKEFRKEIRIAKQSNVPVIANIFGSDCKEFKTVAKKMEEAGADMLELNISCPNTESSKLVGQDPQETYKVTKAVKNSVSIPIIVKLTPNVADITEIAKAAIDAGADAISAVNTLRALYIDIDWATPLLSNNVGGMSGLALKPVAVKCVAEIALLIESIEKDIPIIGVGGVYTGRDVIEFIMAGASAVQIGTAILHNGPSVFQAIVKEIEEFMTEKGYHNIQQMKGLALKAIKKCKSINLQPILTIKK